MKALLYFLVAGLMPVRANILRGLEWGVEQEQEVPYEQKLHPRRLGSQNNIFERRGDPNNMMMGMMMMGKKGMMGMGKKSAKKDNQARRRKPTPVPPKPVPPKPVPTPVLPPSGGVPDQPSGNKDQINRGGVLYSRRGPPPPSPLDPASTPSSAPSETALPSPSPSRMPSEAPSESPQPSPSPSARPSAVDRAPTSTPSDSPQPSPSPSSPPTKSPAPSSAPSFKIDQDRCSAVSCPTGQSCDPVDGLCKIKVACSPDENEFETEVEIIVLSDADMLTSVDISGLESVFAPTYNDLADSFCDPLFRRVENATITEIINATEVVNSTRKLWASSTSHRELEVRRFRALFKSRGSCRGCNRNSRLYDEGGRRLVEKLLKGSKFAIESIESIESASTSKESEQSERSLELTDICFCDAQSVAKQRAPSAEEFAVEYNQAVMNATLPNVQGTGAVIEVPRDQDRCLAVSCPSGQSCDPIDGTCKANNALRPCIAVIDESDNFDDSTINATWFSFRTQFPTRPFCLLQPQTTPSSSDQLYRPPAFDSDVRTTYANVTRDEGNVTLASDWATICNITGLAVTGIDYVALFIDNSGSMYTSTVQASYDQFLNDLTAAGLTFKSLENSDEDWITPFIVDLN